MPLLNIAIIIMPEYIIYILIIAVFGIALATYELNLACILI